MSTTMCHYCSVPGEPGGVSPWMLFALKKISHTVNFDRMYRTAYLLRTPILEKRWNHEYDESNESEELNRRGQRELRPQPKNN